MPTLPVDALCIQIDGPRVLGWTRPRLGKGRAHEGLGARAADLFSALRQGRLAVRIDRRFPLDRARDAHAALENRETRGKLLLTVA